MFYVDIPGAAAVYVASRHPDAPTDLDLFVRFTIFIERERRGLTLAEDGYWGVEIEAEWEDRAERHTVSHRLPLATLLENVPVIEVE